MVERARIKKQPSKGYVAAAADQTGVTPPTTPASSEEAPRGRGRPRKRRAMIPISTRVEQALGDKIYDYLDAEGVGMQEFFEKAATEYLRRHAS